MLLKRCCEIILIFECSHIYQLCNNYFQYEVNTNREINYPETLDIPDTTICTNLADFINWTKVYENNFTVYNSSEIKFLI